MKVREDVFENDFRFYSVSFRSASFGGQAETTSSFEN
jgi:hypothetical protein